MDRVLAHLRSFGYLVDEIVPDGKIHRFRTDKDDKKKSGFYACHRNYLQKIGQEYFILVFGTWRLGGIQTYSTLNGVLLSPDDKRLVDRQLREARLKAQKVKDSEQEKVSEDLKVLWDSLSTSGSSAYLDRKNISSIPASELGVRYDERGNIVVPARDCNGRIWSVQYIRWDGAKWFHPGGRVRGCFHTLGSFDKCDTICVCEGFATGASVRLATGLPVAIAFTANNLVEVSSSIKRLYPDKSIVICGDDDRETEGNPGRTKAEAAATACAGRAVFPKFKTEEGNLTDWSDLHISEGIEEVHDQIFASTSVERFYSPLEIVSLPYPDENEKTFSRKGTMANVVELLRRLRITVRYNVISKEEEILIPDQSYSIDNQSNATLAFILDWCERVKIPTGNLVTYLTALADRNPYNPVATWIESKPWDGKCRLQDLCDTLVVEEKDRALKEKLVRAWLLSAVAALYEPEGVSAHGVLVLRGEQYIGKTAWFKRLAPKSLNVIADGISLDPSSRDSVSQVISNWLVELGELDATFRKSDISALKAFLTRDRDTLRRPFAKRESSYARRTVFFGSVNDSDFLKDPTGNRRFWTIDCKAIDYNHNIDMQQLWAEVREMYRAGESWYLTADTIQELNTHNVQFQVTDPVEERIHESFEWKAPSYLWRWVTATQICQMIGISDPTQAHTRSASRLAAKLASKTKISKGYRKYLMPPLPSKINR